MLTRDQILGLDDLKTETVNVPEWGGAVIVRSMTAADRDEYEQSMVNSRGADEKGNMRNIRARLIICTAVDESGKRLFTDADIDLIGAKAARAVNRVFKVAARLNALTSDDVDDLAKNSDAGLSEDSSSS